MGFPAITYSVRSFSGWSCLGPMQQFSWIDFGAFPTFARPRLQGEEQEKTMNTQTADLMSRYELALEAVLATVEPLPAAAQRRRCPEEQCSAAALAGHIAAVHEAVAGWVNVILAGDPLPPLTMADIDRTNADQAMRNDGLSKDEALARLRASGATMIEVLRGLSENDLARSAPFTLVGGEISVQTLVEQAVIAHTEQHLASLRAAVGNAEPPPDGI